MHPIALISVIFWLLVLDIIFLISLPKIIWITITVSLAVLLVTFSVLLLTRKTKYGKAFKIVNYSTVGVAVAALTVSIFHYNYLKKHAFVDTTNINVYKYLPFDDDSKIARLDEDSSLKFSNLNNLPKVDGAAALFPLYSAFVNAVYPSSIEPLNYRDGCFFYTNTIESYKRLALGERDIVFGVDPTNRKDELESLANENGIDFSFDDLELVPMGREGLIFFVNSNNSIDNLTSEQLRGIYSAKITNWKQVGGSFTKIMPLTRNVGSGSYTGLQKFMGDNEIVIPEGETELVFGAMSGIIEAAADDVLYPGAIGYSYFIYASQIQANNNVKLIGVDGVHPSMETIGNNTYPITDSFYMVYNKKKVTTEMTQLMNWVLSSQGQELVKKTGYAPVNIA